MVSPQIFSIDHAMEKLIFIISQPRAGSTLLASVLSNHEQVTGGEESWFLLPYLAQNKEEIIRADFNYQMAQEASSKFLQSSGEALVHDKLKSMFKAIYSSKVSSDQYLVEKTPRYYEILDELWDYFPDSRYIILTRNPISVLNSIIQSWNVQSLPDLYPYRRDLLVAPESLLRFYEAHKDEKNVLKVSYEKITNNPETAISEIFGWLKLTFQSEYLQIVNRNFEFGDQKIRQTSSIREKQNIDGEEILLKSKLWKKFTIGYLDYLCKKGIQPASSIKPGRTNIFDTYIQYCQVKDNREDSFSLNLRRVMNSIQMKYIRIFY